MVVVEYAPLAAVADCKQAIAPGAPRADTRKQSNIIKEFRQAYGNVEAAFAGAPHRATLHIKTHRGCAHALEGRAVLASYDALEDRLTVWDSTQESHDVRGSLMTMLGLSEEQLRVVAADVGGGFGAKHLVYPEEVVVAAVSRMLRRPVKWIEDRRESFLSTIQERDQYWDMEVAFDGDGRLLGMRGRMIHDQGAYTPRGTNLPTNASTALPGPYRLPCLDLRVIVAETNKVATIPIRGAGYPSANFVMERALDQIAHTLGLDRAEVRRRNLIPADAMPYDTRLAARSGVADRLRQRRLSEDDGGLPRGHRLCRLPGAPAARAARRPPHRHRHGHGPEGHGARSVRIRHGAHRPLRQGLAADRRGGDRPGPQDRTRADLRRGARRRPVSYQCRRRRHRRHLARARRLRQPADRDGRLRGPRRGGRGAREDAQGRRRHAGGEQGRSRAAGWPRRGEGRAGNGAHPARARHDHGRRSRLQAAGGRDARARALAQFSQHQPHLFRRRAGGRAGGGCADRRASRCTGSWWSTTAAASSIR